MEKEKEEKEKEEEEKGEEEKKEEKIPHMCESTGHRSIRGRCPKRHLKKKINQAIPGK